MINYLEALLEEDAEQEDDLAEAVQQKAARLFAARRPLPDHAEAILQMNHGLSGQEDAALARQEETMDATGAPEPESVWSDLDQGWRSRAAISLNSADREAAAIWNEGVHLADFGSSSIDQAGAARQGASRTASEVGLDGWSRTNGADPADPAAAMRMVDTQAAALKKTAAREETDSLLEESAEAWIEGVEGDFASARIFRAAGHLKSRKDDAGKEEAARAEAARAEASGAEAAAAATSWEEEPLRLSTGRAARLYGRLAAARQAASYAAGGSGLQVTAAEPAVSSLQGFGAADLDKLVQRDARRYDSGFSLY